MSIALAQLTIANIQTANIDWADIANLAAQIATIAAAQITAANIESANVQWAQIASLNAAIANVAKAQITTANINSADINWAEIASLQAGVAEIVQASIGSADINYARIKDMVSDTAIITTGEAGQLYINRLCVTEANMVSLTVGELMLKGEDGQFYRLTAGAGGEVIAVPVMVEGANVADATLSGSNLIEDAITCRELNVGSIFADSAMVGAIKAANIDVGSLFASEAYVSALRTNIIQSDIGAALNISSNESILSRVTQETYDAGIAELQATDESLSTTIEQTASGIAQCVTKGNLTRYQTFDAENGVLIGDTAASYKVQILSDRVNIPQNGLAVAYFAAGQFYIMEGELTDSLTVGNYQIRKTADGGLAIG